MSDMVIVQKTLEPVAFGNFSVSKPLFRAVNGLLETRAGRNEVPEATVEEQGIRLEFAQFGHFTSFDVIRSMVSMASVADADLPTPIATGLKTMYYVDSNVVEGLVYYYKVRVWRGATSFVSDEVEIEAVEGDPLVDEFVVAFNEFDTGVAASDDPTGRVWNNYSAYWEVEAGKGFLRLPQAAVAFINLPAIGAQDYTMELFVRLDDKDHTHGAGYLLSTNYVTSRSWPAIGIRNYGALAIYINGTNKGAPALPVTIRDKILAGEWVHIAYERYGVKTTCYIEGFAVASDSVNPDIPALKWCFGGADTGIATTNDWFQGSIDCVRASVGIARYKEAFTPPPRGYK